MASNKTWASNKPLGPVPAAARAGLAALVLASGWALSQAAAAQTMNANSAAFNAGFGRTPGEENRPPNVSLTDANGNTTLVNGLIQPAAGSLFAEVQGAAGASALAGASASAVTTGGVQDSFSGAGGASASAIGNNLNVVVQGDNNTVVVTATQTNNAAVTATASGK